VDAKAADAIAEAAKKANALLVKVVTCLSFDILQCGISECLISISEIIPPPKEINRSRQWVSFYIQLFTLTCKIVQNKISKDRRRHTQKEKADGPFDKWCALAAH
jgi:hypothetical protein